MIIVQNSFIMFLQLTEDLHFSKAADRCHVTQQALSDNIRRLESEYGPLFERRPQLKLTPAGEAMKQCLLGIRLQENAMREQIHSIQNGETGEFTLGMNRSRASILLPRILPQFYSLYPNIRLNIVFGETRSLETQMFRGKMHAFLGVNTPLQKSLRMNHIYYDSLYLVISRQTAIKYLGDAALQIIADGMRGIRIKEFESIPMVLQNESTTEELLSDYCRKNCVTLNRVLAINDLDTQIELCQRMNIMTVCPSMFVSKIMQSNKENGDRDFIYAFPIAGLEKSLRIDMVTPENINLAKWLSSFIEILTNECLPYSYM